MEMKNLVTCRSDRCYQILRHRIYSHTFSIVCLTRLLVYLVWTTRSYMKLAITYITRSDSGWLSLSLFLASIRVVIWFIQLIASRLQMSFALAMRTNQSCPIVLDKRMFATRCTF